MGAGRKPKPTAMKELEGNPGDYVIIMSTPKNAHKMGLWAA